MTPPISAAIEHELRCPAHARIAGTRIAVKTIVSLFLSGMSGDEVAFWCAVTIEDVDAALRYALRRGKKR